MRLSLVSLAIATTLATGFGCASEEIASPWQIRKTPEQGQFRWQQFNNLPSAYDLSAGYLISPDEIYAVGPSGLIIAWDGQTWSEQGVSAMSRLYGVWGTEGTLFAVGDGGRILHRNRLGVWDLYPSNTEFDLRGIHGWSADHIFAVGDAGTILHYNGLEWTPTPSSVTSPLFGVWVASDVEAFAVGLDGVALRWSLTGWTQMDTPTRNALTAIHGTSNNNLFAVGNHGTIIRYIGDEWRAMENDHPDVLQAVWAFGPNHVVAGGANGTLLQFNGIEWRPMSSTLSGWVYSLAGFEDVGYGFGSGVLIKYSDREWISDPSREIENINSVWGTSVRNVTAVGDEGSILTLRDGRWIEQNSGTRRRLEDVWGSSPNDIYVVGDGRILHFDGSVWTRELIAPVLFTTVFGTSSANILAASAHGQIYRSTGDGQWLLDNDASLGRTVRGLWVPPESHQYRNSPIYAVGSGILSVFDGATWTSQFTTNNFNDITGRLLNEDTGDHIVYAVGGDGVFLQQISPQGVWEAIPSGTTKSLRAVVIGRYNHVYVAGDDGIVQSYDGDEWKTTSPQQFHRFNTIWAASDGEMFLGGGDAPQSGILYYYGPE